MVPIVRFSLPMSPVLPSESSAAAAREPRRAAAQATDALPVRRMPVGAEPSRDGRTHFRVWAPTVERLDVVIEHSAGNGARREAPLAREDGGYWAGWVDDAPPGTRYRFRLDGGDLCPDPASRFQPEGPHGPSEVVDPGAYVWSDAAWRGIAPDAHVLYELHVGAFTREGTWDAARRELPSLAELGVTTLEIMPVADFPGRFGWGYDGVAPFAPTRLYGRPDDFRRFVDEAHALGLAVILDVVYNHLGPDGNYLTRYSPFYLSETHGTEWGQGFNFDGPHCAPVREYVRANAAYWIDEYHLDGLRLDATQAIVDESSPHILTEIGDAVRAAARGRETLLVNENEPQRTSLVRPTDDGGCGLDMIWNDDWHHSALVALTGRDEAYYTDYRGTAQEFVSAAKHGFLYQGQYYRWQRQRRGTPTFGLERWRFVHFLQNHDQIANSGRGERAHQLASPARLRALTALLLLGPQTPMLFMGQEFAASAPFLFFADHERALAHKVAEGRRTELSQFVNLSLDEMAGELAAPDALDTFERCRLDHGERETNARWWRLHRDLLRLRREDPLLGRSDTPIDGAVLGEHAFVLRFFAEDGGDRLLVVNLGAALHLDPAPEPLLAPPLDMHWRLVWSSEDPRYGGLGTPLPDASEAPRSPARKPGLRWPRENWRLTAECAAVLAPTGAEPR
jgi:maltooligosyltrehalose trehalohydrolase